MNKQREGKGIEWTNYTWNPVGGCLHGCRWEMPDGNIAECYAKNVAEKLAQKAYPQGFEHHYWRPHQLNAPRSLKTPARIFVDSMSDLMGKWVQAEQIEQVIEVMRDTPQHTYQLLTKNAPRYLKFDWPKNVWLGISTPPTWMNGYPMTDGRASGYIKTMCRVIQAVQARGNLAWISAEPLTVPLHSYLAATNTIPDWCVIGAASNGKQLFPPDGGLVRALVGLLDFTETPVFFKGNMHSLDWAVENWREEFPMLTDADWKAVKKDVGQ